MDRFDRISATHDTGDIGRWTVVLRQHDLPTSMQYGQKFGELKLPLDGGYFVSCSTHTPAKLLRKTATITEVLTNEQTSFAVRSLGLSAALSNAIKTKMADMNENSGQQMVCMSALRGEIPSTWEKMCALYADQFGDNGPIITASANLSPLEGEYFLLFPPGTPKERTLASLQTTNVLVEYGDKKWFRFTD